jgi:hypothetical protein
MTPTNEEIDNRCHWLAALLSPQVLPARPDPYIEFKLVSVFAVFLVLV